MASKKNRSRKSLAIALAIVGVAGLSMASAATLTVNSDEIVAGADNFTGCDTAVDVSYVSAYHVAGGAYTTAGFYVSDVTVDGIATTACDNLGLTVIVTGTGGAVLSTLTGNTGTAGTVTLNPAAGAVKVDDVYGVAVAIG